MTALLGRNELVSLYHLFKLCVCKMRAFVGFKYNYYYLKKKKKGAVEMSPYFAGFQWFLSGSNTTAQL